MSPRAILHLVLHLLVPAAVARLGWRPRWRRAWGIMLAGLLIDLDHLLADPIFDPNRCSVGYHPLHTWPAIVGYLVLTAIPRTRLLGAGLMIHIALDLTDCFWMKYF
jgi:hypothetical protein